MIRVRCPVCDRRMDGQSTKEWPEFPFCSPRCRLIDLGRWLGGQYRIAAASEDVEQPPPPADESETP
ncbi:MAG TPA: DNA gyrase inhibitor YacG [Gemmataceae bacterium]|nr:DNA gyrase inhibitor YacG [Gemmataceae bacterium]